MAKPPLELEERDCRAEPVLNLRRLRNLFPGRTRRAAGRPVLFESLQNYSWRSFSQDARAGLNVALLDFPQGMAYAIIAGLPFFYGIYASAVAAFLGPFLASSRFIMLGPTNAIAVLTLSTFLYLDFSQAEVLAAMPLLLMMVALLMLLGGLLRVANLINFVSRTVITGYITAAAFLIIAKQLPNVLGIGIGRASTVFGTLENLLPALGGINWPTALVAGGTGILYLSLRRISRGLPAVALSLLVMYFVAEWLRGQGFVLPPLSEQSLSAGQWPLTLPTFSFELAAKLAEPALAIAFLSLLESASIAKTLAARAGDTVNLNQQMVSMGVANAGCAFLGGMPISGSLTRSVLNWKSGARTPVSSLVSALLLILGVLFLAPYISRIPLASLSMLVILVGVSLLNGHNIRLALASTNSDAATFLATFISGLLLPLDTAIYLGFGISVLLFLKKAAEPHMVPLSFTEAGQEVESQTERPALSLLHVEGDLFFGSSDIFLEQARRLTADPALRVIILRLRNAYNLDATCAAAIEQLVDFAREKNRDVILSGVRPEVERVLRNSRVLEHVGPENIFREDPENPTASNSLALKRAQQIAGKGLDVRLWVSEKSARKIEEQ